MTILPKKKITSKEKVEQQRYANNQRHIPPSVNNQTLSPDMVLPPFSSAASYNYQNYLNSHRTPGGSHDSSHSLYARSISQNHLNSWININPANHNEEFTNQSSRNLSILSPNTNHGGVSKRKKKRDGNNSLSNAMLSVKSSSWKPRTAESCLSDSNEGSQNEEFETTHATGKSGSPSQPHQNSEDEYENQNEVSSQEQELRFERQLKAKKGFLVKKMREDGACLFRAISDQIYGDQDMHSIIRNLVCDYMVKNRDFFHQFVTEDFNKYIERKRVDSEHGNHVELQAISEMYNRPIEIYIYEAEPSNVFQSSYRTDNPPIRLSYHNNMHYNSVIDPFAASVGIGLGLPSFTPGIADKNQMKDAIRASESQYIEQAMYEDKLRATDWEATSDAISEAVLRESRLQFLRDQEKQLSSLVGTATAASAASTSPRSSPGYSANMATSSGNCGKPCCSYSTASPPSATTFGTLALPPSAGHGRESPGYGGVGIVCSDMVAATTASNGVASCCFTSTCTNSNFTVSISGKEQQSVLSSQRASPHHHSNYQLRSLSSSPKASSFSPNAAIAGGGNKSPLLSHSVSSYNNGASVWGLGSSSGGGVSGGGGNSGPSSRLSPCPSPDTAAAMNYMWSPNSPKMLYTAAGADMLDTALVSNGGVLGSGAGGGESGSSMQQQQQQATEYNLLRALMESQLEYYNSFSRSAAARKSPPSSVSPQPGPSTS